MTAALGTSAAPSLLVRHGLAWSADWLYRLAWLVGPQAITLALGAWLESGTPAPPERPASAGWVRPSDGKPLVDALAALRDRARTDAAAEHLLRQRAQTGDKAAQFFLATLLDPTVERGRATPERTREALDWYRKSAEQNAMPAMANLGFLLGRDDLGIAPDYAEAFKWLERAAPRMPAAQRNLSVLYRTGRGVPTDKAKSMELLRSAAEHGDAPAQFALAEAFDHGTDGLAADSHEAVLLYQRAATRNNVAAQRELAQHLLDGRGVPADREQALSWMRKAAASGDAVAQTRLVAMERGASAPPSIVPGPAQGASGRDSERNRAKPIDGSQGSAVQAETAPSEGASASCPIQDWQGSSGRGKVIGLLSEVQSVDLLARTQAKVGAPISSDYVHNARAVVAVTAPEGTRKVVALVPNGMTVGRGDHVAFTAARRDPATPCSYIPNLVSAILPAGVQQP